MAKKKEHEHKHEKKEMHHEKHEKKHHHKDGKMMGMKAKMGKCK